MNLPTKNKNILKSFSYYTVSNAIVAFLRGLPPELLHLTAATACELTASDIINTKANLNITIPLK